MRRLSLSLVALCPLALFSAPARPCSAPAPTLEGPIAPAEGAVDVPTNALLHVRLDFGVIDFTATLSGGEQEQASLPVARDDRLAVVDLGALAPETEYTIELRPAPGFEDIASSRGPFRIVTGAAEDTEAPVVRGAPSVSVEHVPGDSPLRHISTCGPQPKTNSVSIGPLQADDDHGVAGFLLFRMEDNGGRVLKEALVGEAFESAVVHEQDAGTYRYGIVAFDLAGNESEPLIVEAVVPGCNAAHVPATGAPASAALLVLLALALRRGRALGRRSIG